MLVVEQLQSTCQRTYLTSLEKSAYSHAILEPVNVLIVLFMNNCEALQRSGETGTMSARYDSRQI